jgi:hypothetical protein
MKSIYGLRLFSTWLLFLLIICSSHGAHAQSISLSAATKLVTNGAASTAVTSGDFNGDGKADLAVAHQDSNNVSVLVGNGDGTFSAATLFTAGYAPRAIANGDVSGDGKADLIVANETGNDVSVLLGVGDGTFQPAVSHGPVDRPEQIAIADFNLDGKQDLAIASFGGSAFVMFGNGDGTFQPPVSYSTGVASTSVTVGDFNSDGKPDLAVANQDSSDLSVLINAGDGSFAAGVNYVTAANPVSISAGDFNRDGKLDLVTADMGPFSGGYFSGDGFLSVLAGNGDGTFQAAVDYSVGRVPHAVAVCDLNQDGALELIVANAYDQTISVLAGAGDATFAAPVDFSTGDPSTPFGLSLSDFNGDGKTDIATANFVDNSASILINQTTMNLLTTKQAKTTSVKINNGKSKSPLKSTR